MWRIKPTPLASIGHYTSDRTIKRVIERRAREWVKGAFCCISRHHSSHVALNCLNITDTLRQFCSQYTKHTQIYSNTWSRYITHCIRLLLFALNARAEFHRQQYSLAVVVVVGHIHLLPATDSEYNNIYSFLHAWAASYICTPCPNVVCPCPLSYSDTCIAYVCVCARSSCEPTAQFISRDLHPPPHESVLWHTHTLFSCVVVCASWLCVLSLCVVLCVCIQRRDRGRERERKSTTKKKKKKTKVEEEDRGDTNKKKKSRYMSFASLLITYLLICTECIWNRRVNFAAVLPKLFWDYFFVLRVWAVFWFGLSTG